LVFTNETDTLLLYDGGRIVSGRKSGESVLCDPQLASFNDWFVMTCLFNSFLLPILAISQYSIFTNTERIPRLATRL
jgi:hypothetical protein